MYDTGILVFLNFIFIGAIIIIRIMQRRSKILKKGTAVVLNVIPVLLFVFYIIFCHLHVSWWLWRVYDTFGSMLKASLWYYARTVNALLASPCLYVCAVHFIARFLFSHKINRKGKLRGSIEYYRDDLQRIHPGLLSLVYKLSIDAHSSITSVLLKLKLEGYIEECEGKPVPTGKQAGSLLISEAMVLDSVSSGRFNLNDYFEAVKREAKERELIKTAKTNGCATVFISFMATVAVLIALAAFTVHIESNYPWKYIAMSEERVIYIEVEESVYNRYNPTKHEGFEDLPALERLRIRGENLVDRKYTTSGGKFYIRADAYGGFIAQNIDWISVALDVAGVVALFGAAVFMLATIITAIRYYRHGGMLRTPKGTLLVNEAFGLKNFLKDFTIMKERTEEELPFWEYYLIYAVVLDVNVKIEDEVISRFVKSVSP